MRTGVWLIGARGSVATTGTVGAPALRSALTGTTGCVTELIVHEQNLRPVPDSIDRMVEDRPVRNPSGCPGAPKETIS